MSATNVPFPIICDNDMKISQMYNTDKNQNYIIILDTNQKIRLIMTYPTEIGINIYEILRCIDALQKSDLEDCMIPANWVIGNPTILKAPNNYMDAVNRLNDRNFRCIDWYLCFNN